MAEWYRLDTHEALQQLNSSIENGLPQHLVNKRTEEYGRNELPTDEGINWFKLIGGQFTDLMVIILLIAAVISAILGDTTDVIVIMIIVILNAALGIYQEYQAEEALARLSAMQVPMVTVRRNGSIHQISATELVPGDIVLLEEGSQIPADGRLLESVNLRVEEAALTGESLPVDKHTAPIRSEGNIGPADRNNSVFMGTAVVYGRGTMIVTDTGLNTEIGKIAGMLMGVEQGTTPLQRRLNQLGRWLAAGAGIVVLIVFIAGLTRGVPWQDMFLIAISLAVAAVPEGLPALVTISLSLGAGRMVRRHALIRRLPAVETLGSVTTICSDKTGTLTKNEMTATYLALPGRDDVNVTGIGYTPSGMFQTTEGTPLDPTEDEALARFLKAMALSTNAYLETVDDSDRMNVVGDTTEGALLVAAQKVGWTRKTLEDDLPRVAELPFSSERKAMTTVHAVSGSDAQQLFGTTEHISITKGAPDRLIEWASYEHVPHGCAPLTDERRAQWTSQVDRMANEGLRVLGVAYRVHGDKPTEPLNEDIERDLCLIGLVGILDPARDEAKSAVKVARAAGIRTIMITGDHALTGEAIARDLGILDDDERAITGAQLDSMTEDEIRSALEKTSCFARVSPSHKLAIVRILQEENQIVAMTGDGVNDAPALKQADIGVAMGITGTDVSKGAAAMVLTDDNFASIVAAVEEGRAIYDNIKKFIKYLLSSNVGEILVMFVALLAGLKLPLLAIQILWINLVTDGLPAIALGFEPAEPDVMNRDPRPRDESIFAGGVGRHIIWVGILIAALTLGGYIWGYQSRGMDAFSNTLGLETLDRATLIAAGISDDTIPAGWNTFSEEKRTNLLLIRYENLSATEMAALTDQIDIPENWDELTIEERQEILGGDTENQNVLEEGNKSAMIAEAERAPRTIAFTILAFTQMFEVMAIHAGDRLSFFRVGFKSNRLLLWAVLSTFVLQLLVIYVPFLQSSFDTAPISAFEIVVSFLLGAVILVAVEIEKFLMNGDRTIPQTTTGNVSA